MNITEYISSGILEQYWLGILNDEEKNAVQDMAILHPEIAAALNASEKAVQAFSVAHSFTPPVSLKNKIWQSITNWEHEKVFAAGNTPIINRHSDYRHWLKVVQPLLPVEMEEDIFTQEIRNDGKVSQVLIKTKVNYPDEVHEDVQECFIVLEGECECYIGDDIIWLGPGGYLDIPLHQHHDVRVLTPYVTAVVQRIAV